MPSVAYIVHSVSKDVDHIHEDEAIFLSRAEAEADAVKRNIGDAYAYYSVYEVSIAKSQQGGSKTKKQTPRRIHTGPQGGQYYIKSGRKVYV